MKEIKLYGVISNEGFLGMGENGYIERIANAIKDAGDKDINLRINTPGGSVFDGYAIITNLLEHKGKLNMQVDGYAASMGGAILAYADSSIAYDFAKIMLHKVWTHSENDEALKLVGSLNRDFAAMFKKRGVDAELIDEIFLGEGNKDFWFSAQEAQEIGLIDKVLESNIDQKAAAYSEDMISKYYDTINQKREIVMFGKHEKELIEKLKGEYENFTEKIDSFLTKEDYINLNKEEGEKLAETINEENQKKFDEMNEQNKKFGSVLSELPETIQKLTETVAKLEKSNEETTQKIADLEQKIDDTVKAIQGVVSDFKVPEAVDGAKSTEAPQTKEVYNKNLSNEINDFNAERK